MALRNDLPATTSIHWRGLRLRDDMDGVPGTTQDDVAAGSSFTYSFRLPDARTYWFQPYTGLQLDKGLYARLVVEDPKEDIADVEHVVVLDDWLDGLGSTPEQQLATLQKTGVAGMGMDGMDGGPGRPR